MPAAVLLTLEAPTLRSRLAVAVFGACIATMFGVSATVHLRRWSPAVTEILFRADHTAIFLAIAGTATPIALLGLSGTAGTVLLWVMWTTAALGIAIVWWPRATPHGFATSVFITMGSAPVVLLPQLLARTGWGAVALLLGGGALYIAGAVIVALRRPDPDPQRFGYHEIWHLMVIAAVLLHYWLVWLLLP